MVKRLIVKTILINDSNDAELKKGGGAVIEHTHTKSSIMQNKMKGKKYGKTQ